MQSKILRAIQENTFRRVGGQKDIRMDVRIISSCNEDPFRAIADNQFRKDLFYRLSTVMIELPPLREHKEDLEELIPLQAGRHGLSIRSLVFRNFSRGYGNLPVLFMAGQCQGTVPCAGLRPEYGGRRDAPAGAPSRLSEKIR